MGDTMNKKGFTLVELIGVITLLAVLLILVTTGILNIVSNTYNDLDKATEKLLYNQAEIYLSENIDVKPTGIYYVTIKDLIDKDKVSSNFLDGYEKEELSINSCVKVTYANGLSTYDFIYDCTSIITSSN